MSKKKKKVVAYCRVSTLEQKKNGYGIDIQIRDATLCSERHGVLIEKFYTDEGESGVKEKRPALKRLMRDCKAGRIKIVILPSLDRLSREVRIAENLFYDFKRLGVRVLIADMPQYNGERKDIMMRQILEAVAEENRREIIDRLFKGRQERVRRGYSPGGNLPYGYVREDKMIIIDPREAEIIKKIYALDREGATGAAIAEGLNNDGYRMRNNRPWTQRQVCRILHRESLYRQGIVRYGSITGTNPGLAILEGEAAA